MYHVTHGCHEAVNIPRKPMIERRQPVVGIQYFFLQKNQRRTYVYKKKSFEHSRRIRLVRGKTDFRATRAMLRDTTTCD